MNETGSHQHHFEKRAVTFGAATNFAIGENPRAIVAADINGDGNLDVVTANPDSNSVSVLLGSGNNAFGAATTFPVGSTPSSLAVADFNKDGYLDIVTANQRSNSGSGNGVSLLLGTGMGSFKAATNFPLQQNVNPSSIAVGDMNNDNNLDVVTIDAGGYYHTILFGGGSADTFWATSTLDYNNVGKRSVAIADFNNDGNPDIIANNVDDVVLVLGFGEGAYRLPQRFTTDNSNSYSSTPSPQSIAVADFNNDGHLDTVTTNIASTSVSVLWGNSKGSFWSTSKLPVGEIPSSVTVGDFDGDGNLDIAVTNSGQDTVSVILGTGAGPFQPASNFPVGTNPVALATGDFNQDGKLDIVTAHHDSRIISVLLNQTPVSPSASGKASPTLTTSTTKAASKSASNSFSKKPPTSSSYKTAPSATSNKPLMSAVLTPTLTLSSSEKTPDSSQEPTVSPSVPMSNGTLALLIAAPLGGLLLLSLMFGLYFYKRYRDYANPAKNKDIPMLPINRDEDGISSLFSEEPLDATIDESDTAEHLSNSSYRSEPAGLQSFSRSQPFFQTTNEHRHGSLSSTHESRSDISNEI